MAVNKNWSTYRTTIGWEETTQEEVIQNTNLPKIILNMVYPVGSIYTTVTDDDPNILFGGTWVKIEDKFLLSSGSTYTATYDTNGFANKTGGEATHKLTESEMPSHTHKQNPHHHDLNRNWSSGTGSKPAYAQATNRSTFSVNSKDTTATNQNTGGGQAHNNMPPYLVVNVWKRTQ